VAPLDRPDQTGESGQPLAEVAALRSAVAGLAREVESLGRGMRQVPTSTELAQLAATVADLSETVSAIQLVSGGGRRRSEAIPSWLTLPRDVHDVQAVLSDLTAWTRDVYLRYGDASREFPECWLWHPDIVEELVWLMHAWLAAYRDDDASVRLAGDWHDRLRPGVVRRVHTYARTCSLENHLPGRPNATGAPHLPVVDDDSNAAGVIAAWWTEQRDQPGPTPTDDQMAAAAAATRLARTGTAAVSFSPRRRVPRRTDLSDIDDFDDPGVQR
jgi:hypothetical protein